MATATVGNSVVFLPSRLTTTSLSRSPLLKQQTLRPPFSARIRTSAATAAPTETVPISDGTFACPICYNPLIRKESVSGPPDFECRTCKKGYFSNGLYVDATVTGGSEEYGETRPSSTELFRTPLVSFLYERGWRQTFIWGGFPGPEKEFEMAKDYLRPTIGGAIIDASCGSGLFSRMFAKSSMYSLVVALDFSENMLRQCYEFINQEDTPKENVILVRADVSRLPFRSGSIDAVHAGAALHCWPSPSAAVAEISRVLRPSGVFVATTAILDDTCISFRQQVLFI